MEKRGNWRSWIWILVTGGAALIVFWAERSVEPVVNGKRLSQYLDAFSQDTLWYASTPPYEPMFTFRPSPERTEAWEALPKFGTNALPLLIRWMQAEDSKTKSIIVHWLESHPGIPIRLRKADRMRTAAVIAFSRLASDKSQSVAALTPQLRDLQSASYAVSAIHFVHSGATSDVLLLTNALAFAPEHTALVLAAYGTNAAPAVPLLMEQLEHGKPRPAAAAATALARIKPPGLEHVAQLIEHRLQSPNVRGFPSSTHPMLLWSLGEIGPAAKPTLPTISNLVNDLDGDIKRAAQEAIKKVGR